MSGREKPTVEKVRVLTERNYLEIHWDREVEGSVDIASYVLKNGDTVLPLLVGNHYTMYFKGYAMSSIGFRGTVDPEQPLTLEIVGEITDAADGTKAAEKKVYEVGYESYYTKFYVAPVSGITVKSSDDVADSTLEAAAAQIDVMLSRATDIARKMVELGASLAVYGAHENAYFIPEHRYGWDPAMYYVEGYGGSPHNGGVSSIAEKNVLRIRDSKEPGGNTAYRNENILIHEFGHAVRLMGLDQLEDTTLKEEFLELYRSRAAAGMWPNTYAISNSDEFFATMCTVWFNVMQDAPDWNDGVRGPVNTREELKVYDPETYAFFAGLFPEESLPAPWDTVTNNYPYLPEGQ